jgi:hypothetical protein
VVHAAVERRVQRHCRRDRRKQSNVKETTMKNIVLTLALMLSAMVLQAQTAQVIPIADSESTEIAALYAQLNSIQQKIEDFDYRIADKYLSTDWVDSNGRTTRVTKDGWEYGFDFSTDFKFIVPTPAPQPAEPDYHPGWITPVWGSAPVLNNTNVKKAGRL